MITLTERAIKQAKAISESEKYGHTRIRVRVLGGGCAGFQYDMYFDDIEPLIADDVSEQDGVTIVVDPLSYQYIDGVNIDYVVSEFSEGFKFENPNIEATCGCGSSFKA